MPSSSSSKPPAQTISAPHFSTSLLLLVSVISSLHIYTHLHITHLTPPPLPKRLSTTRTRTPTPPATNLHSAWRDTGITCTNWISTQRATGSYIDAYIIGAQKGGTSILSKRLYQNGVKHKHLRKEWHMFSTIRLANHTEGRAVQLPADELAELRMRHYHSGFFEAPRNESIPVVSNAPRDTRKVVIDGTVEYMHNSCAAFFASAATPHARVVMTLRDPIDRALSQYNMLVRIANAAALQKGDPTSKASPHRFHDIAMAEMAALTTCGYDVAAASYAGSTCGLMRCVERHVDAPRFYVLRGLYPLHIRAWRGYFPDRHIMYISFREMAQGRAYVFNDLCKFLCVRAFDRGALEMFRREGGEKSYGQRSVYEDVSEGFDSYEGDNVYLGSVLPKTRRALERFFAPAMKQTAEMLGKDPF